MEQRLSQSTNGRAARRRGGRLAGVVLAGAFVVAPMPVSTASAAPAFVYDLALANTVVVTGSGEDTSIDYQIVVANQGDVNAVGFTVVDLVAPGLVVDEASISDFGTYDAGLGTITWLQDDLLVGGQHTLSWSATVGDFSLRPFRNYAEIVADSGVDLDSTPDTDNTNDTGVLTYYDAGVDNFAIADAGLAPDAEDDADIAAAQPSLTYDLALAKTPSATTVSPSGSVVFTLTVENQGDVNSGDYTITDTLPSGTSALAASDGGVASPTTVTWSLTDLAPGAMRSVTVTVAITDAAQRPFKNIAEISADGASAYDAFDDVVADTDSFPDTTTNNDADAVSGDGYGTYENPLDDVDGIADVDSIANGEDDADVAFFDAPVRYDLALVKTGPATIDVASTATFTIQVKNQGNVASGSFTVLDTIPTGLAADSASNGGVVSGQSVTWHLSGLAAGATTSVTVTVHVVSLAGQPWTNVAEISSDGADSYDSDGYEHAADGDVEDDDSVPDSNTANDALVDQTTLPAAQHNDPTVDSDDHDVASITAAEQAVINYDLALVKILPGNQSFRKDSNVTFQLQVKNQGNVASGAFTVQDVLPAGLTFVSAGDNPLVTGQVVTWDVPSIAAGETKSISIVVRIVDVTLSSYVNRAEIVSDGADTYDTPFRDVEDEDSTPDANLNNDLLIDNDDVNIDSIPGDEDDHDRAALDPAKVASDNPVITGTLPQTGSAPQPLLYAGAGLLAAGALSLAATRRRRSQPSAAARATASSS